MELFEILADTPWLLTGSVFVLSLLVGSFLNVVIYRLPIMLDRQWRAQAEEMLGPESSAPPTTACRVLFRTTLAGTTGDDRISARLGLCGHAGPWSRDVG